MLTFPEDATSIYISIGILVTLISFVVFLLIQIKKDERDLTYNYDDVPYAGDYKKTMLVSNPINDSIDLLIDSSDSRGRYGDGNYVYWGEDDIQMDVYYTTDAFGGQPRYEAQIEYFNEPEMRFEFIASYFSGYSCSPCPDRFMGLFKTNLNLSKDVAEAVLDNLNKIARYDERISDELYVKLKRNIKLAKSNIYVFDKI